RGSRLDMPHAMHDAVAGEGVAAAENGLTVGNDTEAESAEEAALFAARLAERSQPQLVADNWPFKVSREIKGANRIRLNSRPQVGPQAVQSSEDEIVITA